MNSDLLFKMANNTALIGWFMLIFLPRWRWSARLVAPVLVPMLMAILYVVLIATQFSRGQGSFSSLTSVALLFQNRGLLLAGWVHYLAFDLIVGSWEVRDAQRIGIAHYLVTPCLILTFLFGPAGWLLYFLLRSVATHNTWIDNGQEHDQPEATLRRGSSVPAARRETIAVWVDSEM
jgi:hypothetical protein